MLEMLSVLHSKYISRIWPPLSLHLSLSLWPESTSPLIWIDAMVSYPVCFYTPFSRAARRNPFSWSRAVLCPEYCSAFPLPSGSWTQHGLCPTPPPLLLRPLAHSSPAALAYLPFFQHSWRNPSLCSSSSCSCPRFALLMFSSPSRLFSNFVTEKDPMGSSWDRPLPHILCFNSSLK